MASVPNRVKVWTFTVGGTDVDGYPAVESTWAKYVGQDEPAAVALDLTPTGWAAWDSVLEGMRGAA